MESRDIFKPINAVTLDETFRAQSAFTAIYNCSISCHYPYVYIGAIIYDCVVWDMHGSLENGVSLPSKVKTGINSASRFWQFKKQHKITLKMLFCHSIPLESPRNNTWNVCLSMSSIRCLYFSTLCLQETNPHATKTWHSTSTQFDIGITQQNCGSLKISPRLAFWIHSATCHALMAATADPRFTHKPWGLKKLQLNQTRSSSVKQT